MVSVNATGKKKRLCFVRKLKVLSQNIFTEKILPSLLTVILGHKFRKSLKYGKLNLIGPQGDHDV